LSKPAGFVAITCIESWLATAGLSLVKFDFTTDAAEHFDGAGADIAPKLIDETGYE
jgi:hypothetical protein